MKTFETGKTYQRVNWSSSKGGYFCDGTIRMIDRTPRTKTIVLGNGREFSFTYRIAEVNGKRVWVDLGQSEKFDSETVHEINSKGEWKRNTIRFSVKEIGEAIDY